MCFLRYFLHNSRANLLRLFFLLSCLGVLDACKYREVSRSLREFSNGSLSVGLDAMAPNSKAVFSLEPEAGFSDCAILDGTISATLNGQPPSFVSPGSVFLGTEGYRSCVKPSFTFLVDSLGPSPIAPDGEFVIEEGLYSIRITVSNLLAERKLSRITAPTSLKPGSEMRYFWEPGTDSSLRGTCTLEGHGDYFYSFDARIESDQLIAVLPTEPWPMGTVLYFDAFATAPIRRCEGIQTCEVYQIRRQDKVELPPL